MKKIFSFIAAILMCLTLLPLLIVPASAENDYAGWSGDPSKSMVHDDYGIFDDNKEKLQELNDLAVQYSEKLEMNICVYIAGPDKKNLSDNSVRILCDDDYDEIYGENTDGVFYYMDLSGKSPAYDYISTSGKCYLLYQKHIDSIFSRLDNYLPPSTAASYDPYKDNIAKAVETFFEQLDYYNSNSSAGGLTYYYDSEHGKYIYYKNGDVVIDSKLPPAIRLRKLIVSILSGVLVAFVAYLIGKSKYKFKRSENPGVYVSKEQTVFDIKQDNFLRTNTSRSYISSSSGSSGGSRSHSGGGHSHGGSHGGGGHHR